MNFKGAYFSVAGPKHPNQDSVLPLMHANGAWVSAIADGVGGEEGAAIAAHTATEIVATLTRSEDLSASEIFQAIKERIKELATRDRTLSHMATTLSAIWLRDTTAHVGHVGDTRIYHLRDRGIVDRTQDQTEAQHLVRAGVLTRAQAKRYTRRNVLVSALSADSDYELFEQEFELRASDRLILLSDGVHGLILRQAIRDLAALHPDPQRLCTALVNEVAAHGPNDDYSAVCINVE